MPETDSANT